MAGSSDCGGGGGGGGGSDGNIGCVMKSVPAGSNGYAGGGNADDYDGDCDGVGGW